ncbi:MAG: glucosidase [Planctomycetota bacterium]
MRPRPSPDPVQDTAEGKRLADDVRRVGNWKRWGPYLAERQWATVREDYSADGSCWDYLPHDHARSRAYRWGEDGLLGFTDRQCRLCFAIALWNGVDPILKERLFGLTGTEGNHGEDVKEAYFYLDSTPTHSYCRALYKYPQRAFPYDELVRVNAARSRHEPEFELADTDIFADGRFFDVEVEYAKGSPDDVLVRISVHNRGPTACDLHVLPTLWFRNTWSWGREGEGYTDKPRISRIGPTSLRTASEALEPHRLDFDAADSARPPTPLFCDNETNTARLFGSDSGPLHPKDAFHAYVVHQDTGAVATEEGTKAAFHSVLRLAAGARQVLRLRLRRDDVATTPAFADFDRVFAERRREADEFYAALAPARLPDDERRVLRQAYAGMLWTKQFYYFDVATWLEGDPSQPAPPAARRLGRNHEWRHLYNRDVVSVPDGWEYPWYAAWDLAFHTIPFAHLDPWFAKGQLVLFLREWYMAPNGQLPAYEFAFGDVNPPVHAWACWRVYKLTGARGRRDRTFLARTFQKLLINFTWWVNRKDPEGEHIFSGGFLGLDNIGVFDRSRPLPDGSRLEQADATAWMAFFCATMLSMALELAHGDPAYEDVASKFFEHFVAITEAMNTFGGRGLWDDADGFYYDQIRSQGRTTPLRVRSMVGLIPLFAVEVLEEDVLDALPAFSRRMHWFLRNRPTFAEHVSRATTEDGKSRHLLLAIPGREQLTRVLQRVLDESEFLSPFGVRSLSKAHATHPFVTELDHGQAEVEYVPGESNIGMFGGNSNWRGPVWFPLNYLLIEALQRYHHFYGDTLKVECPVGSGRLCTLDEVARELARRLCALFLPDADGERPFCRGDRLFAADPTTRDLVLFHEYFDGETGRGLGASHQTGWTGLVTRCLETLVRGRDGLGTPRHGGAAPM